MLYNLVDSVIYDAAYRLNDAFREKVSEFKHKQVQVAKKSFARASAKPNSAVAALVERNNRLKLKNSLVPSSGTLLVVPSVLMEHWQVSELFAHGSEHTVLKNIDNIPMFITGSAQTACEPRLLHKQDTLDI